MRRQRIGTISTPIDDEDTKPAACHQHGGSGTGATGANNHRIVTLT
jgi:hypothetical protein